MKHLSIALAVMLGTAVGACKDDPDPVVVDENNVVVSEPCRAGDTPGTRPECFNDDGSPK